MSSWLLCRKAIFIHVFIDPDKRRWTGCGMFPRGHVGHAVHHRSQAEHHDRHPGWRQTVHAESGRAGSSVPQVGSSD